MKKIFFIFALLFVSFINKTEAAESLYMIGAHGLNQEDKVIVKVDPASNMSVIETIPLVAEGRTVFGVNGATVDPTDNSVYIIVRFSDNKSVRYLATLNMQSGEITEISIFQNDPNFAGIAFDDNGVLFGITGDYAPDPMALYSINKETANVASLASYFNQAERDDGETLTFHNGLLYRVSGKKIFSIDPQNPSNINLVATGDFTLINFLVSTAVFDSVDENKIYLVNNAYVPGVDFSDIYAVDKTTGFSTLIAEDILTNPKGFIYYAPRTQTPTATPQGGIYDSVQTITLSTATEGATIYYTTDGTDPTTSSIQYTGPITVSTAQTIIAVAVKGGMTDSAIMTEIYSFSAEPTNPGPTPEKFLEDIISGFITIDNADPTQVTVVTFTTEYTITDSSSQVVIPANTVMTKTGGGTMDFTSLDFEEIADSLRSQLTTTVAGAVSIGIPNLNLTFSNPITIKIPVDPAYNGQTLNIYFQNNNESTWNEGLSCTVADSLCTFQTNHATIYLAGDKPNEQEEVIIVPTIKTVNKNSIIYKRYEEYKDKFKKKSNKKRYFSIKELKRKNYDAYFQMKTIYEKYRKTDKSVVKSLDLTTQEIIKDYKGYRGYKKYRNYKEKTGE